MTSSRPQMWPAGDSIVCADSMRMAWGPDVHRWRLYSQPDTVQGCLAFSKAHRDGDMHPNATHTLLSVLEQWRDGFQSYAEKMLVQSFLRDITITWCDVSDYRRGQFQGAIAEWRRLLSRHRIWELMSHSHFLSIMVSSMTLIIFCYVFRDAS